MATTRTAPRSVPAHRSRLQHPLVVPGAILVLALIALVLDAGGVAAGLLLVALGAALYLVGKRRRWKGAPEAGLLVGGLGGLLAVLALFT